jgi:hypothetical protein
MLPHASTSATGQRVAAAAPDYAAAQGAAILAGRLENDAPVTGNERAGRGLGWNTDELLALCSSGLFVDRDNVRGSGMRKTERTSRIAAEFKRSSNMPEPVLIFICSSEDGSLRDPRRWTRRSTKVCFSQREKLTSQCNDFHQFLKRVKSKHWTGSPQGDDFIRATTALRNGTREFSNLYHVLRSASYPPGKKFIFVAEYQFLAANNYFVTESQRATRHVLSVGGDIAGDEIIDNLLQASGAACDGVDEYHEAEVVIEGDRELRDDAPVTDVFSTQQFGSLTGRERPEGAKSSKRMRKKGGDADSIVERKLTALIHQSSKVQSALSARHENSTAEMIAEPRKSNELRERALEFDDCRTLFGHDAPPEMRAAATEHLRNKWLQNMARSRKSHPNNPFLDPNIARVANPPEQPEIDHSLPRTGSGIIRPLCPDDQESEDLDHSCAEAVVEDTRGRVDTRATTI